VAKLFACAKTPQPLTAFIKRAMTFSWRFPVEAGREEEGFEGEGCGALLANVKAARL
jgi:hypothetical protein